MRQMALTALTAALVTFACGAAMAAEPAAAPGATVPPTPPATAAKPIKPARGAPDEVICKSVLETGSRLGGKRVCMTRADWTNQSREASEFLGNSHPTQLPSH